MFALKSRVLLGCLALCMIAVTGCGDNGPKLYRIKGTVTHKGKPVPNLMIIFKPLDEMTKAQATGFTDANGKFELKVAYDNPGVFPGEHTVIAHDPLIDVGSKTSTEPDYLAVIAKFGPGRSPMKYDVTKNESNLALNLD
ncbi:MAG: carboxypeptidase-like regulatory domain-containing protein [Pirellulales bacterium]